MAQSILIDATDTVSKPAVLADFGLVLVRIKLNIILDANAPQKIAGLALPLWCGVFIVIILVVGGHVSSCGAASVFSCGISRLSPVLYMIPSFLINDH